MWVSNILRVCLIGVLGQAVALAGHPPGPAPDWSARVYQLDVTRADGQQELGSAVPLAGERLVTNCHVLRGAVAIQVRRGAKSWSARADKRDTYRDLCFLTVSGLRVEPVPMIEVGQTRVGLDVLAVGYPGGSFSITLGKVVGLHACECDGGKVIQTSAPFEKGASGGGLFDHQGRLVGILTFKSHAGGHFHFALPVGWLRHLAENEIEPMGEGSTFWERPGRESAYFLAACDLGARRNWGTLHRLSLDWIAQEPNNPEAWMALGRARLGSRQVEAAATAFQRAFMLDTTHSEARWALEQLELELGRQLLDTGGV